MAKVSIDQFWFELSKEEEGKVILNDKKMPYDLIQIGKDQYHLLLDNRSFRIEVLSKAKDGSLHLKVNGQEMNGRLSYRIEQLLKSMGMEAGKKIQKDIKAPMPGLVLDVLVSPGQEVAEGDDLIILEAMKMENALKAPQSGTIESVNVNKQDKVDKNQVLVSYK